MTDPRVRALLDTAPWSGETPRLALLDFDVVLRTEDAVLGEHLTNLFAGVRDLSHEEEVRRRARDERPHEEEEPHVLSLVLRRGEYLVHLDGTRVIATPAPSIVFADLLWQANREAIDRTRGAVLVHAAAAARGGVAVILPGAMNAGKSTLVAGLADRGLGYLTDELVAIDPESGRIRPYAKYLSLGDHLADTIPAPPESVVPFLGSLRLLPVSALRVPPAPEPATPRLVVAPIYEPGAPTTIERIRPAEALLALAEHTFHLPTDAPRALATLADVVAGSECFRLVSGDLDAACDAVLTAVDDVTAAVPS